MLLEEFEYVAAVIEPTEKPVHDKGEVCETIILSFNGEILKRLIESEEVYPGGYLKSINGQHPWYMYGQGPSKLAVMLAPIGAPMIVGQLEELAARGFKNFIILGSCGVLDHSIEAIKSSCLRPLCEMKGLAITMPHRVTKSPITSLCWSSWKPSLISTISSISAPSLGRRMPFIGKRLIRSSVAWLLEPKWWTWKLRLSWLGVNFARQRSINSSTQLTMWIIITESGMLAMKSGQLMP